jgi:hypothetical protein
LFYLKKPTPQTETESLVRLPGQMPSRLQRLDEARKMLESIVTGNEQALREPQRRLEGVGGLGAK